MRNESSTTADQQPDHRPTLRVLEVLEVLAQHPEGSTLTDLSQAAGISKSTMVPILRTMERHNFIAMDPVDKSYTVGIKAFSVGSSFVEKVPVVAMLRAEMERVVSVCQETCQLGVLDGPDVLYIAKVDSTQSIRLISSIGKRIPAYCTALGKALLSEMPAEAIAELFPEPLDAFTSHTLGSVDEVASQIAAQRETGIFRENEESSENVICFSVPLRRADKIIAAVSISVLKFRLTAEKEREVIECLNSLRENAERLLETYPESNGLALN